MEDKYEAIKLKNQLCFPLYLCSKEIVNRYAPILDELNLTYTQYIVMMYFWECGQSNIKELSSKLLLDPSTLTPLLKNLEKKGYISRIKLESDKRNVIIALTSEGDVLKDKALSVPEKMGQCIDLSEEEVKCLYSILYKVLRNIEKSEEKKND